MMVHVFLSCQNLSNLSCAMVSQVRSYRQINLLIDFCLIALMYLTILESASAISLKSSTFFAAMLENSVYS